MVLATRASSECQSPRVRGQLRGPRSPSQEKVWETGLQGITATAEATASPWREGGSGNPESQLAGQC